MKTYKKIYIGKGKKVANLDIIKISFNVADITELTHEYKGEQYLSFEVAKMLKPDQFDNEYTVYVNKLVSEEPAEASTVNEGKTIIRKNKKQPKHPSSKPAAKKTDPDELPF